MQKSNRQKAIDQIKYAGANNDRKLFTFVLLNSRISRAAAERYYQQGQNLGSFVLNREKLIIQKKGEKHEDIEQLPAQKRA